MKRIILVFLSFFLFYPVHSQTKFNEILLELRSSDKSFKEKYTIGDSLYKQELEANQYILVAHLMDSIALTDTSLSDQAFYRYRLAYEYAYAQNHTEAITKYHEAIGIYKELGLSTNEANCYNSIALSYKEIGSYEKALDYYKKSIPIYEKEGDKNIVARTYSQIGMIYEDQGDWLLGLDYYFKSLREFELLEADFEQSVCLINIGSTYLEIGDFANSRKYFEQALSIKQGLIPSENREININVEIAVAKESLAGVYAAEGNLLKAKQLQKESLSDLRIYGDEGVISEAIITLAGFEHRLGNSDVALTLLEESINMIEGMSASPRLTLALALKGEILNLQLRYTDAIKVCEQGKRIAVEIGILASEKDNCKCLADAYAATGQSQKAYINLARYIQLTEEFKNEESLREATKKELEFNFEKERFQDSLQNVQFQELTQVKHQAKLDEEKNIRFSLYVGLSVIFLFGLIMLNRFVVTRKQKNVIEEQKEVVEEAHKEIRDSIAYAKRIQSAILPPFKLIKEYLNESFILYKPKDVVAGDFYWMEHKDGKVLFAAADCTGHGVPGAMVSVICNNGLNRSVKEYQLTDPGQILDKTREIVIQEFEKSEEVVKDGMDIALCSIDGMELQFAGANNPLWILRNNEILETKANKQPIGQFDNPEPYTTHTISLESGDLIYIFSDGYVDQFGGEKEKKFKPKAFRRLLLSICDKSMPDQKMLIDEAFENWKGSLDQVDDVCVIGVRV